MIQVRRVKNKGRGVIATKRIKANTVIETCPILVFDVPIGTPHILEGYAFRYDSKRIALVLGLGSIYNHSFEPNAFFDIDKRNRQVEVKAIREIAQGEEVCINYAGSCTNEDEANLWFKVR